MSVADTNVLVFATVPESPFHARACAALVRLAAFGPIAITRQIMREYLATITRPQSWSKAMPLIDALAMTEILPQRFDVLDDGPLVWAELSTLAQRFVFGGKQVYDANIVATMRAHGERRLLTFNVADFRRFSPVIEIIEP